jgi:tetratricopeptide (TPR) repeat protein
MISNGHTRRSAICRGAFALGSAILPSPSSFALESPTPDGQSGFTVKIPVRIIVVDSRADALQIQERLKKGEDFPSLAMKFSIDPTAKDGGYLGDVDPAGLRPELRDAVRGIGHGEVSPVFKISEGYAILTIDRGERTSAMGENATAILALTGPGAIHYGPTVDGFGEVYEVFNRFPDKPRDWDKVLRPVTAAELHRQSLSSGIQHIQELLAIDPDDMDPTNAVQTRFLLAQLYAFQGEMEEAIEQWKICYKLAQSFDAKLTQYIEEVLGIAYLHKSEMDNHIYSAPGEKCIFPMSPAMRFEKTVDSENAAGHFLKYLDQNPDDLEVKWLLNLTVRTLGRYPDAIPNKHLIPLAGFESKQDIGRFEDVAPQSGIKHFADGGGIIVDDFENRGLFDIVLSNYDTQTPQPLRYFHNNGDGTFIDRTEQSGLSGQLCGLNMLQADYNNDGCLDILVLRGAWVYPQRMSLFRGNGDGKFEDVTVEAGLGVLAATQAAVWADINNDGLLDLFVGNEKGHSYLFLNKGDGTFEDISASSGIDRIAFTKGVVAADYDNDGYVDFYVSNLGSGNFLYHNEGDNTFKEVARESGVRDSLGRSFATWFFDYDNDGWPDLFVTSDYSSVDETLRTYLGLPSNATSLKLYKNNRDGTFEDVSTRVGLNKVFMPMGANFGDIDNDGFLDIYLGTGNPSYGSLVPNVLLRNDGGKQFVDITASSGTGELHKGHGISFADTCNTGHQDLLTVIGGATTGDKHAFRFFRNPGNENNWIRVKLVGVKSNRSAIDARIKVTVNNEGHGRRSIHHIGGSGGSFGANPLEQHVGLGAKALIEEIEILWPASKTRQVFSRVGVNQCIEIKEFATQYVPQVRPVIPQRKNSSSRA